MSILFLLGTPKVSHKTSSCWFMAEAMSSGMTEKPVILSIANDAPEVVADAIKNSSTILLITPNYIHSVPAHVLDFLYKLVPDDGSRSFAVLIQSGFPEKHDSVYIKKYIDRLIPQLGYAYNGCAVMGDAASYGLVPDMCKKRIPLFAELGARYEKTSALDEEYISSSGLSAYDVLPEKFERKLNLMNKIGVGKMGWIFMLRKNKAYKKRLDRPYL